MDLTEFNNFYYKFISNLIIIQRKEPMCLGLQAEACIPMLFLLLLSFKEEDDLYTPECGNFFFLSLTNYELKMKEIKFCIKIVFPTPKMIDYLLTKKKETKMNFLNKIQSCNLTP